MARIAKSIVLVCTLMLTLGACAAKHAPAPSSPLAQEDYVIPDPLEPFNRAMFRFNDWFITSIFAPVRTVYVGAFPPDARRGFSNFYYNLATPVRVANSLLQLKVDKAFAEIVRFALNTVFGSFGLANVTRDIAWLNPSPEDFGQTLGQAGAGHGVYLVLPFLGPSSLRDLGGLVADSVAHPLFWYAPLYEAAVPLRIHDRGNALAQYFEEYQRTKKEAFDPYLSFKDIYTQYREGLVRQ